MRLLGTILLLLAVVIAGMALLLGAGMVVDPRSIEAGLVSFVFLAALAGACWAIGRWLRRQAADAESEWDD